MLSLDHTNASLLFFSLRHISRPWRCHRRSSLIPSPTLQLTTITYVNARHPNHFSSDWTRDMRHAISLIGHSYRARKSPQDLLPDRCLLTINAFSTMWPRLRITQGAVFAEDTPHTKVALISSNCGTRHDNLQEVVSISCTEVGITQETYLA